jgi:hypothetical protein
VSWDYFDNCHPFVDKNLREFIFTTRRKPIAGYRLYDCEECGYLGKQKTRDCHSPSHELCEKCNSEAPITGIEEHPEWPVDKSGNLL